MKSAKRVRFKVAEIDRSQSGRSEVASAPAHDPKTSEFAFFKKFRGDATLKHPSKSSPGGNIRLKCSKGITDGGDECYTAARNVREVEGNKKKCNSSSFSEDARPRRTNLLLSPQFVGLMRSEQGNNNPVASTLIKTNGRNDLVNLEFSSLVRTPASRGPDDFFLESATESVRTDARCMDGDISSKKRAKLQSWAAKTIFPGNVEVLKGCDMISHLLNRLLPDSSESNCCENLKSRLDNKLKESWGQRKLVKYKESSFMDADSFSSWSNKVHRPFVQEEPVVSACLPALECAGHMALGHQDREIKPYYFSNIDYNQSWDNNSARAFRKEDAKSYGSRTYSHNSTTLEYEPIQGNFLNDDPSSSYQYGLENVLSAQNRLLVNGESSTACINNRDSQFLLEYEQRVPEWITNRTEAPISDPLLNCTFGGSLSLGRQSAVTSLMELDQSNDDLGCSSFRRKPSTFQPGWDPEYQKREPEWITNAMEAPSSDSWLDSSTGNCRQSALKTLTESDRLSDDLGHSSFRRKLSNVLWGLDREFKKREPEWIMNNAEAPSSDSWLDSSLGECRQPALTTLMKLDPSDDGLGHLDRPDDDLGHLDQSNDDFGCLDQPNDYFGHLDQPNDDLGHNGLRKEPSNLLLGWDADRLNGNETGSSFSSTAFMHYQQRPKTTTDPDCYYSSSYLPISSAYEPTYLDNTLQRFDTQNNYVLARSHPAFCTLRELTPSESSLSLTPSQHWFLDEIIPHRSYPTEETIPYPTASIAYRPLLEYHALDEAPVTPYSSPYLLLEGRAEG